MRSQLDIFISHAWDNSERYHELIAMLNSVKGFAWRDLSITKDSAITIATGEETTPQVRQFLSERLDAISHRTETIDVELAQLHTKLTELRFYSSELCRYRQIDTLFAKASEEIMSPNYVQRVQELERLRSKYARVNVDKAFQEADDRIEELATEIAKLEGETSRLVREAERCAGSLKTMNIDLGQTGKQRDDVLRRYPNLALGIRNQIALANAVLVIVYPHSAYREWLEFEYQEAFVLDKPLIGLLHDEITDHLPPDLRRFGIQPLRWDAESVVDALNAVTRRLSSS